MKMRLYIIALITLVVGAHVALWTSDMPNDLALKLTVINATGWAVILIPVWLVSKWAAAHADR